MIPCLPALSDILAQFVPLKFQILKFLSISFTSGISRNENTVRNLSFNLYKAFRMFSVVSSYFKCVFCFLLFCISCAQVLFFAYACIYHSANRPFMPPRGTSFKNDVVFVFLLSF